MKVLMPVLVPASYGPASYVPAPNTRGGELAASCRSRRGDQEYVPRARSQTNVKVHRLAASSQSPDSRSPDGRGTQRAKKCQPPHHQKPSTATRPTGNWPTWYCITKLVSWPKRGIREFGRRDSRATSPKAPKDRTNRLMRMTRLIGGSTPRTRPARQS